MLLKSALLLALSVCRASANGQAPLHGDEDSQIPLSFPDNVQQQQPLASIGNSGGSGNRPNIVFILTDDQDLHMQSLDYMPLVKKHLIDQGTFFKRHFCTIAICCPSRVSLWTGRAAHNTNVTDVNPPYGGYPKFLSQGFNEAYLPVWLQEEGYSTYYTGKMFNSHTIWNYNSPHLAGWNGSDFLLDPFTYSYLRSVYQRNKEEPVSYEGQHSVDVLTEKALGLLDEGASSGQPFFLGLAPVAPHSNVDPTVLGSGYDVGPDTVAPKFTAPIPADRHKHLFEDVKVPRTENFNPDEPSGANWILNLPKRSQEVVDYDDHFYRSRLQALQGVDELVDRVVARLEELEILDNTYIIYTSDNGFHIGQHRLSPGKECGFEEDINVPLIVRGPKVPKGRVADIVTTHTDLAPTILDLIGGKIPEAAHFDGDAIPLTSHGIDEAAESRHEHVNVEFWGLALAEGKIFPGHESRWGNNTYKALRIVSEKWNLYYSVWCTNEHELYDLKTDPGQLNNLLAPQAKSLGASRSLLLNGHPLDKVAARLDSLLFVLKSCKEQTCIRPWHSLHPAGNVNSLDDALSPRFDDFYAEEQVKIEFNRCEFGYILDAEGPQFDTDGLVYRHGLPWSEWT